MAAHPKNDVSRQSLNETQYKGIFNNSHVTMLVIDPDTGRILDANEAASNFYGYSKAELTTMTILDINTLSPQEIHREMTSAKTHGKGYFLFQHRLKNGELRDVEVYSGPIDIGDKQYLYSVIHDITESKKTEKALHASRQRLMAHVENTPMGVIEWDPDFRVIEWNHSAEKIFGYTKEEALGRHGSFILSSPSKEVLLEAWEKLISKKSGMKLENENITKEGRIIYCDWYNTPLFDEVDQLTAVASFFQDITDRKQVENKIRESNEKYQALFNQSGESIFLVDPQSGRLMDFNDRLHTNLGYSRKEFEALSISDFDVMQSEGDVHKNIRHILDNGKNVFETKFRSYSGAIIDVLVSSQVVNIGGKKYIQSTCLDISHRKKVEKELKASLKEKEILLQEVHHRVKNNLAVIISLLDLQASNIEDDRIKAALHDSRDRVKSMALIHESLYQSTDFAEIKLADYAKKLANRLIRIMRETNEHVMIIFDIEDIHLNLEQAIPFGLILNELLTNALKYAFPDGKGQIRITAHLTPDREVQLMIHDNGMGLPRDFNLAWNKSLGLSIVSILAESQLEGKIDVKNTDGACFIIQWPIS